jgi:hypothetical protein
VSLSNKGYLVGQKDFPVRYLLIIIEFDAVGSELVPVSLNKQIKFKDTHKHTNTHTHTHTDRYIYIYIYIYIRFNFVLVHNFDG